MYSVPMGITILVKNIRQKLEDISFKYLKDLKPP